MGYSSRVKACDFQVVIVPCPPEHLHAWYASILLWWELVSQYESTDEPLQDATDIEESSSNKNLEVPKFTPFSPVCEGDQKALGLVDKNNVA